jgi:hypothetical protein
VTLAFSLLLAACGAEEVWAPEEDVQRALYRHDGPPAITFFTMINNRSNEGAHSGLMVNASQRAIFDPAGSFHHPQLPERNDVFFGITPAAYDFYIDYHARETYRVAVAEVPVSAEQAEIALRLIREAGPVAPTLCNYSIADVLRQVPGFEDAPRTIFPLRTKRYFEGRPGVRTAVHRDASPANRGDLMKVPSVR